MYAANSMHLTVVENQQSLLQVGKTVAVVSGANFFGGRRTNSYQDRQVGTLVSVQAVASDDGGIAMSLQFEKSEVHSADPVSEDEQPIPASTATLTHQSTVQLKDGHSVLVGTLVDRSGEEATGAYLVIGAKLQQPAGEMISFRSFSRSVPSARGGILARGGFGGQGGTVARGGFGTRAASPSNRGSGTLRSSSSSSRRPGSTGGAAGRTAAARTAAAPSRYGDNKRKAEERQKMSRKYPEADSNKDGLLTVDELVKAIMSR